MCCRSPANFKKGEFDVSSSSTTTSYTDCNGMVCYKYLVGTLSFSRDYISIAQSTLIPDLTLHLIIWGSFFIDAGAGEFRVGIVGLKSRSSSPSCFDSLESNEPTHVVVNLHLFMSYSTGKSDSLCHRCAVVSHHDVIPLQPSAPSRL